MLRGSVMPAERRRPPARLAGSHLPLHPCSAGGVLPEPLRRPTIEDGKGDRGCHSASQPLPRAVAAVAGHLYGRASSHVGVLSAGFATGSPRTRRPDFGAADLRLAPRKTSSGTLRMMTSESDRSQQTYVPSRGGAKRNVLGRMHQNAVGRRHDGPAPVLFRSCLKGYGCSYGCTGSRTRPSIGAMASTNSAPVARGPTTNPK